MDQDDPAAFIRSGKTQRSPSLPGAVTPTGESYPPLPPISASVASVQQRDVTRSESTESLASTSSKRGREEDMEPLDKRSRAHDSPESLVSCICEALEYETKRISKGGGAMKIREAALGLTRMIAEKDGEIAYMKGRLDERICVRAMLQETEGGLSGVVKESVKEVVAQQPSLWSGIVKAPPSQSVQVKGMIKEVPAQPTPVVFIRAAGEKKEAAEIKKEVLAAINPAKEKMLIRNVRAAGDGRIVVEAGDWTTVEKLKGNKTLKERGLAVSDTNKVHPRVIIYDVDVALSDEEFLSSVHEQNLSEQISLEAFKKGCRPVFKKGRRDAPKHHFVCEVSPEVRRLLVDRGRVYISWFSCKVEDFVGLSRCFKCQEFGHVSKLCRGKEVCKKCGAEGHQPESCPRKDQRDICIPCKNRKLSCEHVPGSRDCITYLRGVDALMKRVNYG